MHSVALTLSGVLYIYTRNEPARKTRGKVGHTSSTASPFLLFSFLFFPFHYFLIKLTLILGKVTVGESAKALYAKACFFRISDWRYFIPESSENTKSILKASTTTRISRVKGGGDEC